MIYIVLAVLGLALGSFVNAVVYRVHEQAKSKKTGQELSILKGRSMCPHCRHALAVRDLVPLFSWLSLRGKCRYCHKPISRQYPLVEAATALLFVLSYFWWPVPVQGSQTVLFGLWLALLTGFMALIVYDLRWLLLPDRLLYPLTLVALVFAGVAAATAVHPGREVLNTVLAVAVGGGVFYVLFQVSAGKWIGGGDVKLGWLLGLIAATPARSLLMIFSAALLGSLASLPLLLARKLQRNSTIPFGPFLIVGAIVVQLFGHTILLWYRRTFLPPVL
jgi:prepilin signal peptidase PulO-like enzyme (type II secretory pathway)